MLKDFWLHSRNDLLVSVLHLLLDSLKDLKKKSGKKSPSEKAIHGV